MANTSLNDSVLTINISIDQYDALIEAMTQVDALMSVILVVPDLALLTNATLHAYLGIVDDMLHAIDELLTAAKATPFYPCLFH